MKNIYFTLGPSQIYPTVKKHLENAFDHDILSISHRGDKFKEIYKTTSQNLKKLLDIPTENHIFFLSSSLESMEKIIEGCVFNQSFHFINGAFSQKFHDMAVNLNKKAGKIQTDYDSGFDFKSVRIPEKIDLICFTHNETSIGVALDMNDIYKIKSLNQDKLIAIDLVSSVPCVKVDFSKIDIGFFSVQKGFGLPAGLGVLIVNQKAIKKAQSINKNCNSVKSYHSFQSLLENEQKFQTPETPNVLLIYLLGKVCEDMIKHGIKNIWRETEEKAEIIYDYIDKNTHYKPFVKDKNLRSTTTIIIDVNGKSKKIIYKMEKYGYIIGSGYGKYKDGHIRIANFPAHKIQDIRKMLELLRRCK